MGSWWRKGAETAFRKIRPFSHERILADVVFFLEEERIAESRGVRFSAVLPHSREDIERTIRHIERHKPYGGTVGENLRAALAGHFEKKGQDDSKGFLPAIFPDQSVASGFSSLSIGKKH